MCAHVSGFIYSLVLFAELVCACCLVDAMYMSQLLFDACSVLMLRIANIVYKRPEIARDGRA